MRCRYCGREVTSGKKYCRGHNPASHTYRNTKEGNRKISLWNTGRPCSEEKLRKMRENNPTLRAIGSTQKVGGYTQIKIRIGEKNFWVYEQRLIVEQHLGRKLRRGEVVHHINEDRADNCVENLMVFSSNGAHLKYHADPLRVRIDEIIFNGGELNGNFANRC